ncbi:protein PROCA1, partial [Xenopus tropicalis]|uniref:phospholipase A2 n=2 Tax=Xenopus tropicalis TaxID=8364 RepID=A0A8J1J3U8_XENTR
AGANGELNYASSVKRSPAADSIKSLLFNVTIRPPCRAQYKAAELCDLSLSPGRGAELAQSMWEIPALLIGSVMCAVTGVRLEGKACALLSYQGHFTHYQVTDGRELVSSTWDSDSRLLSCSVSEDEEEVGSLFSRCSRKSQQGAGAVGLEEFAGAKLACEFSLRAAESGGQTTPAEPELRRVKRGFTYPGTLWCGAGNNAETFEDLGEHTATDACCRTHDHCAHVIHPFSYRYGYRNYLWHTISHCQCDTQFKDCLRRVNDTASRVVGQAFYNVIKVPCFEFMYKSQCVERYWYGWCKTYNNESVAVPKDSGLYDFGGDLIDQVSNEKEESPTQAPAEQPTLGQVMQATEDLLKLMMTVSPSTSSDLSKVEETKKKEKKKDKKKKKKKERKHKKGKGLKGKKKGQSQNQDKETPGKDLWGENIGKNEGILPVNQALDQVLDLGRKQDDFNDVLNDEPARNAAPTLHSSIIPVTSFEYLKSITKSLSLVSKPYTENPQKKKSRQGRKGKRERKKKSQTVAPVLEMLH